MLNGPRESLPPLGWRACEQPTKQSHVAPGRRVVVSRRYGTGGGGVKDVAHRKTRSSSGARVLRALAEKLDALRRA